MIHAQFNRNKSQNQFLFKTRRYTVSMRIKLILEFGFKTARLNQPHSFRIWFIFTRNYLPGLGNRSNKRIFFFFNKRIKNCCYLNIFRASKIFMLLARIGQVKISPGQVNFLTYLPIGQVSQKVSFDP